MSDRADTPCDLDLVREHVDGDARPAEFAAIRARLGGETAEFLDAYRALADVLGRPTPSRQVSRTTFEQIERRIVAPSDARPVRARPWLRGAAATALFAFGVWAGARLVRPAEPESVHLTAPTEFAQAAPPDAVAEAALACAAVLSEHVPLRDGDVVWLSSLARARDAARVTGRPVLLFLCHPTCPVCADLERGPLADPAVRERIAAFVPVKVIASFDDPDPALDRDWPYFAILGADGLVLADLPVPAGRDEFVSFLDAQIEGRIGPAAMTWERARDLSSRLRAATDPPPGSAPGHAYALAADLARDPTAGPFAAAARAVAAAQAADARRALVDAAAASASAAAPGVARTILDDAARRFAGTPYGNDLAAVRDAYARTGRFPRLDPALVGPAPR